MSLEFYDLLELRERWHELHRLGDTKGLAKAEELAGLRQSELDRKSQTERLNRLPSRMRESLEVPEREWEAKLAHAALNEGFQIVRLLLSLDPAFVQVFRDQVIENLDQPEPWGGILYFESATETALKDGQWQAHLYLAIAPGRQLDELPLQSLTGVTQVQGSERMA